MNAIKRVGFISLVTCAFLAAQPALAGLVEFTYNSNALPWVSTIDRYQPSPEQPTNPVQPSFSFSFTASDSFFLATAPVTVTINDAVVAVDPAFTGDKIFKTKSSGTVTINPDGTINAWDVDLKLTEIRGLDNDNIVNYLKYSISIFTASGPKNCDCDLLRTRYNTLVESSNRWDIVGPIDINYGNSNQVGNWSIKQIVVPEPAMGSMILAGLGLISFLRLSRRRKKSR